MFSFGGALPVRVRLKEMELALVTVLIREGNKVEADWCKRSIVLANYKQQATLAQVSNLGDKNRKTFP